MVIIIPHIRHILSQNIFESSLAIFEIFRKSSKLFVLLPLDNVLKILDIFRKSSKTSLLVVLFKIILGFHVTSSKF